MGCSPKGGKGNAKTSLQKLQKLQEMQKRATPPAHLGQVFELPILVSTRFPLGRYPSTKDLSVGGTLYKIYGSKASKASRARAGQSQGPRHSRHVSKAGRNFLRFFHLNEVWFHRGPPARTVGATRFQCQALQASRIQPWKSTPGISNAYHLQPVTLHVPPTNCSAALLLLIDTAL